MLEAAPKPAPVDSEFDGCGDAGSQPDYELNRLKNRVDEGEYLPVSWKLIARLPWPRQAGYRFRHQWIEGETGAVARFEGVAVEVEGYLAGYRLEIPEAPNCYSTAARHKDFHLWLSKSRTTGSATASSSRSLRGFAPRTRSGTRTVGGVGQYANSHSSAWMADARSDASGEYRTQPRDALGGASDHAHRLAIVARTVGVAGQLGAGGRVSRRWG